MQIRSKTNTKLDKQQPKQEWTKKWKKKFEFFIASHFYLSLGWNNYERPQVPQVGGRVLINNCWMNIFCERDGLSVRPKIFLWLAFLFFFPLQIRLSGWVSECQNFKTLFCLQWIDQFTHVIHCSRARLKYVFNHFFE